MLSRSSSAPSGSLLNATSRVASSMVLSAMANGVLAVLAARELSPTGRGVLALIVATVSLTAIFVGLGTNTAARYHLVSRDRAVDLTAYLGLASVLVATQGFVCLGVTHVTVDAVGADIGPVGYVAVALFGSLFLAAWCCREALYAFGFTATAALFSAFGSCATVAMTVGSILWAKPSVLVFVSALLTGSVIELVLHLGFLVRRGKFITPRLHLASAAVLLRRGLPALGLTAGQSLAFRLDRYLMGFILGPAAVGVYAVAATASELIRLLPSAFGQVVFFRTAARELGFTELRRARGQLFLVLVAPIGILCWFAPEAIAMVFGSEYRDGAAAMRILLLGELAVVSFQIDSRSLCGLGDTRSAGLSGVVGLAAILLLSLALIPHFGLEGAAWASVVAYMAMGATARLRLRRHRRTENP